MESHIVNDVVSIKVVTSSTRSVVSFVCANNYHGYFPPHSQRIIKSYHFKFEIERSIRRYVPYFDLSCVEYLNDGGVL